MGTLFPYSTVLRSAVAVVTNQTCRLLSRDYLRARTERVDARALARAEERIGSLDRARLIARATGLARDLADGAGRDRG